MNYWIDAEFIRNIMHYNSCNKLRYNPLTGSQKYNMTAKWLKNYDPQCKLKFGYNFQNQEYCWVLLSVNGKELIPYQHQQVFHD